jgi:hypothetical protein
MSNLEMDGMVEFEELKGRIFPIVYRKSNRDPIVCCYCDHYHLHNEEDGHKHTHCSTAVATRKLFSTPGGEALTSNIGYIVKTRNLK